jgi:hypothetical protein
MPKTPGFSRRDFCGAVAAFFTAGPLRLSASVERSHAMPQVAERTVSDTTLIRPFPRLNVPDAELADLRKRINATRWPERETVADQSQGVPLAMIRELARYWATDYDWRKRS